MFHEHTLCTFNIVITYMYICNVLKCVQYSCTCTFRSSDCSMFAKQPTVPHMNGFDFNKDTGKFVVPVYMTPEEYSTYVKDQILPTR